MPDGSPPVAGVLLAGGLSRRMGGGDKCLRPLASRTVLDHVLVRARPQVRQMMLNANDDPARFARWGLPVRADVVEGWAGPLAGVLTGLDWAATAAPDCPWVASFATDAPFLPADLVERLLKAVTADGARMACAASNGRRHPVFGLWPVETRHDLRRALVDDGIRKVEDWTGRYRTVVVDFPAEGIDPFFNVNRPPDLAQAEQWLEQASAAK